MTRAILVWLAASGWHAQAQTPPPSTALPEAQESAAPAGRLPAARREASPAAPYSSDDVSEKIRAFEAGMIPPMVFEGEPIHAKTLEERMAELKVPGVSVAVIDKGRIAWAKGYGLRDADRPDPVTPETLFQAASVSKPVSAVGVMALVEAGKFFLDEDANVKLSSWHVPANNLTDEARVTVRRLLSHTAGLTVHGFRGYAAGEPTPTLIQVLNGEKPANSAPIRVDILPGSVHRYSGGGYTVLQQLVQDVTGREFPAAMRDLVLAKIEMKESTYEQPLPEGRRKLAATGHGSDGKPIPGRWHTYPEMAAAGLWTTPSDLARFAIELQKSLRGESNRVLSTESVHLMITPVADGYGLGFETKGSGDSLTFGHGGSNAGFKCTLVAFARGGNGVVVMTNGEQSGVLGQEIVRTVARIYGWPAYQPVVKKVANIQGELKALEAGPRAVSATGADAATQSALALKEQRGLAVNRLADVLKRQQPRRGPALGDRNQLYMVDLVAGGTTLVADEPLPGLTWCGSPDWSHDGTRIVFDASPGTDWGHAHVMSIEIRDARPKFTDLGPGNCPAFSPDDKKIVFMLNPGAQEGADAGVWVMEADGSQRHRAGEFGNPSWSPDGRQLLVNGFEDFPASTMMNIEKMTEAPLWLQGYRVFSWPSWAGPGRLVAALATAGKDEADTVAILDVSDAGEAKIVEVLWKRGEELDVAPGWPVYFAEERRCYFSGVDDNKRTLYSVELKESRRAKPVSAKGPDEELGGFAAFPYGPFTFSPDGRYLLVHTDGP